MRLEPDFKSRAGERLRELAERKRPEIEALIQRAQAVKRWLESASACDCATVDVCSLFTDAALAPPVPDGRADARGRAPVAEIVDCPE